MTNGDTYGQEVRFCTAPDGVRIAYATVGEGPPLVKAANWLSHLEFEWRSPVWRHWTEELSRDHRYVRYDERGCGLSDWEVDDFSTEAWVRDLETVVDALELERFPLLGISQGGPVAITYAVRHPERVSRLILYGTYAFGKRKTQLTEGGIEEFEALLTLTKQGWGRANPAYRQIFASSFVPEATTEQMRWFSDLCRISTSAENAVEFLRAFWDTDVEALLPQVSVPTLVIHARDDLQVPFEAGRIVAAGIPGSRFVPLEGTNHLLLEEEPAWGSFLAEVRAFLGVEAGQQREASASTIHTILFTDVESSTALTQRLGDDQLRAFMRDHEGIVRESLAAHGGTEIKALGDGFMVSFPSPTRALECAISIQRACEASQDTPIRVRIGVNAGEPIEEDDPGGRGDLFGTAVNMAARIAGEAEGGEVVVSDVVRQLVAGKGFTFANRGPASLRGFEEPVPLHELRWSENE